MVYDVQFRHTIENEQPRLEFFRCVDIMTSEIICEVVGDDLIWHTEPPNKYIELVLDERRKEIMRPWFLRLHGIWPKVEFPKKSIEEIANDFKVRRP